MSTHVDHIDMHVSKSPSRHADNHVNQMDMRVKSPTGRYTDNHVDLVDMHVKWYLVTPMLVRLTFMSIMPLVDILTTMIGRLTYMS